jgi:glucokinase
LVPDTLATLGLQGQQVAGVGIGFGGPVDSQKGRTVTSHQVAGWDDFPLVSWFCDTFGISAVLGNDSDLAGWAEARLGAGRGCSPVVYMNIGSGIGGALVIGGQLYSGQGLGATEIGHLRMKPDTAGNWLTLEQIASGWALDRLAQTVLGQKAVNARDLIAAAQAGHEQALAAWNQAVEHWSIAIANVITLLCPQRFVLGGGVSLVGDFLLYALRREITKWVFAPFRDACEVVLPELGEEMVVHGAILLAAQSSGR